MFSPLLLRFTEISETGGRFNAAVFAIKQELTKREGHRWLPVMIAITVCIIVISSGYFVGSANHSRTLYKYALARQCTKKLPAPWPSYSEILYFEDYGWADKCEFNDSSMIYDTGTPLQILLQNCLASTSCRAVVWEACTGKNYMWIDADINCSSTDTSTVSSGYYFFASNPKNSPAWNLVGKNQCDRVYCTVPDGVNMTMSFVESLKELNLHESYKRFYITNPSLILYNSTLYGVIHASDTMFTYPEGTVPEEPFPSRWGLNQVLLCKIAASKSYTFQSEDCFFPKMANADSLVKFLPPGSGAIEPYADPRAFTANGHAYVVNAMYVHKPHLIVYQVLTKFDLTLRASEWTMAMSCPFLDNPGFQKNWMGLVFDNSIMFVTNVSPTRMVAVDPATGVCEEVPLEMDAVSFAAQVIGGDQYRLHGGSAFAEIEPGLFVTVVHWFDHEIPGAYSMNTRFYIHHFFAIKLAKKERTNGYRVVYRWLSDGFRFPDQAIPSAPIQFGAGFVYVNNTAYITYGAHDRRGLMVHITGFKKWLYNAMRFGLRPDALESYRKIRV